MTHPQMYRINAVDRAGTPWHEVTLMDPAMVMWKLEQLRAEAKLRGNDRVYWVDDPDDEERGDITIELEEAAVEAVGLAEFDRRWVVNKPEEKPRSQTDDSVTKHRPEYWRDDDADRQIRRRVRQWRVKSMLKRIDWWVIAGWLFMVASAVSVVFFLLAVIYGGAR